MNYLRLILSFINRHNITEAQPYRFERDRKVEGFDDVVKAWHEAAKNNYRQRLTGSV